MSPISSGHPSPLTSSGDCVVWAPAALGHHPLDVLGGILDVAGLAVQAVLGIDLQLLASVLGGDVLVHTCMEAVGDSSWE